MSKKVAFITGGTSGIGKAITANLLGDNWEVISPTRDELDLSDLAEVEKYASRFSNKKIEVFIHAAGVWHDEKGVLADKPFNEFTPEEITRTMNVTVIAPMLLIRSMANNLSTVIGVSGTFNNGAQGWLPYYTSKRALEDFLVGLSQDYQHMRVFGISPADTATEAYKKFYPQYFNEAQSPENISKLTKDLLDGTKNYESGSIIEIRQGKIQSGFHA